MTAKAVAAEVVVNLFIVAFLGLIVAGTVHRNGGQCHAHGNATVLPAAHAAPRSNSTISR